MNKNNENTYNYSILTPTYQGRERLLKLYHSILKQDFHPDKWVIIIDGDDIETSQITNLIREENKLNVYTKVIPHNHKKSAVNYGLKKINSYFTLIIDDDDQLINSVKTFINYWITIDENKKKNLAGLCGLCIGNDGNIIGDSFPCYSFRSNWIDLTFKHKISGEKINFYRTSILKDYLFFEEPEGCVGESSVWLEISKKYDTIFLNETIRVYNQRENSVISAAFTQNRIKSNCQGYTYGYLYTAKNFFEYIIYNPKLIITCILFYCRFLFHSIYYRKYRNWMISFSLKNLIVLIIGFIPGFLLFLKDNLRIKY